MVEDDPNLSIVIKDYLEMLNYNTTLCKDGEEGLTEFTNGSYNLVILDIMMPKKSGISIYRSIRAGADTRGIPVIILTGIERGEGFDFHAWVGDNQIPPPELFLEKPIQVAGFLESVAGAINAKKANTQ